MCVIHTILLHHMSRASATSGHSVHAVKSTRDSLHDKNPVQHTNGPPTTITAASDLQFLRMLPEPRPTAQAQTAQQTPPPRRHPATSMQKVRLSDDTRSQCSNCSLVHEMLHWASFKQLSNKAHHRIWQQGVRVHHRDMGWHKLTSNQPQAQSATSTAP